MASDEGYTQRYELLQNNCATKCFDALDVVRARPPGVPPMRGSYWNIRDEFIKPSLEALKARGWIDGLSNEIQPMNDEIKCTETDRTCRYVKR